MAALLPDRLARPVARTGDRVFLIVTGGAALAAILLLVAFLVRLGTISLSAWSASGPIDFLLGQTWDPTTATFGALPFIVGSVVTAGLAMVVAVPVGILAATFLVELAPPRVATPIAILIDLIAALPSVIIGMWGLFVLVPLMRDVEAPIVETLGASIPFFHGPPAGLDVLTASLILAIMVTPTIVSISQAVIATVQTSVREAYLGLGATRWELVRDVVLPAVRPGLLGACLIALGRGLGETMAVIFVIGNADKIPGGLFDQGRTIAGKIASSITESSGDQETSALLALALVLMAISLLVSLVARTLVRRGTALA